MMMTIKTKLNNLQELTKPFQISNLTKKDLTQIKDLIREINQTFNHD